MARARAADVLLLQETKLADADAPVDAFRAEGYELAHHGEGRWNGVAIASRCGIADVVANFGQPLRAAAAPDAGDGEPLAAARMVAASCGEHVTPPFIGGSGLSSAVGWRIPGPPVPQARHDEKGEMSGRDRPSAPR